MLITNILLTAILLSIFAFFAVIFYIFIKFQKVSRDFSDFITPVDANTPSRLAAAVQTISEMFSRSILAQAKGFLMGMKSGEARAETAMQGELLDQSSIGGIVNMLPKSVKRSLVKNPQLLDLAMNFMSKRGPAGNNHDTQQPDRAKFLL